MQLRRRLPILSLLTCLALSEASVARGETLVIAADLWCPINCAADSPRPGTSSTVPRRGRPSARGQW